LNLFNYRIAMKNPFYALVLVLTVGLVLLEGCVSKKKYTAMEALKSKYQNDLNDCRGENAKLKQEIAGLKSKVKSLEDDTTRLKAEIRALKKQMQENDRKFADLKSDYDNLKSQSSKDLQDAIGNYTKLKNELEERNKRLAELEKLLAERDRLLEDLRQRLLAALKEFEKQGIEVYEKDGKIYVSLSNKLLFETGKFDVNKDGKRALLNLAKVLNDIKDVGILIEGHTDNDQYRGATGQHPSDNWELSVLRASTVTKILTNDGNIDPKRVTASGHGEFGPVALNDNEANKAKNRRTDIILVPDISDILEKIKKK
jgi:chemotaxis protein MotB